MYCSQNIKACPSPSNELYFPTTIPSYSVGPKQAIQSNWKIFDGDFREFDWQRILRKAGRTEKCFQIYCMMLCKSYIHLEYWKHYQIRQQQLFFFSFFLYGILTVEVLVLLFRWLKFHLDDRFHVEIFLNVVRLVFIWLFYPTHCSTILILTLVFIPSISCDQH